VWASLPEGTAPADAPLRERLLLDALQRVRNPTPDRALRVLDVGCGEGWFARGLQAQGAAVTGVDVAEEPLRRARALKPQLDLRRIEPEAPLPFEDCAFDAVWAGEVIEHVVHTQPWLSDLRRVLRSGGVLALSTPNHSRAALARLALSPQRFAEHFDVRGEHLRFYNRRSLALLLGDFGFEQVSVRAAGGPPGLRTVLFASAVRARF
jgi:2-polyprenyl-3-methyl-5-hydroxy-6-metoxy-1,4-benzoquinol methylase